MHFLRRGAAFIAANPDWVCPMPAGEVLPDCGSICALLTAASGVRPFYIGKPNRSMVDIISEMAAVPNGRICCVGDRLYTDIAVAVNAGAQSVLVMSGETTPEMLAESDVKPGYVYPDVAALAAELELCKLTDAKKRRAGGPPLCSPRLFGVVLEIVLHHDDWRALVAAAAGEVAEGAHQVRQAAGRGALAGHAALEVGVLPADALTDGAGELLAGEAGELVVGQVLQLQLIGQAHKAGGEAGLTTGSASSHILPIGSLKAPSP